MAKTWRCLPEKTRLRRVDEQAIRNEEAKAAHIYIYYCGQTEQKTEIEILPHNTMP
jgi:hypothetical protein